MAYELQKYARALGVKQHDLNAAIALGRGLQHVNKHDKASKIISEAISKIDSEVEFDLAMHLYKIGSELAEKKNHFSKALQYHKSYKQYSDSLLNNQTLAKVDELQIKFESDQKDTQIQKLSVRNELNALAYKQRTTLLVALLIGLVLMGTIVYLFINRKRILLLRQKEI